MKLHQAGTDGLNAFTASGEGYVAVNGRRFESNVAVLPRRVEENWTTSAADGLIAADFVYLAGLDADIVLLGTGSIARFPAPPLLRPLVEKGIGLEVMDARAACRTFNILVAEGRKVACALLLR